MDTVATEAYSAKVQRDLREWLAEREQWQQRRHTRSATQHKQLLQPLVAVADVGSGPSPIHRGPSSSFSLPPPPPVDTREMSVGGVTDESTLHFLPPCATAGLCG